MKRCYFRIIFSVGVLVIFSSCVEFTEIFRPKTSADIRVSKKPFRDESSNNADYAEVRDFIVTSKGVYYFVKPGDSLKSIARQFKYDPEEVAQINDLFESSLVVGRRIFIPNKKTRDDYLSVTRVIKESKLEKDRSKGTVKFIYPLQEYVLTSRFGMRRGRLHSGLDLAAKVGTPIYAVADGRVIFAKRFAGYGNLIVVKHDKNYFSAYAHASNLMVSQGGKVRQGQQIGAVGMTGRSTGPHLHFEIHKGVTAIDPASILPQ